jgi:hypothetical protein
MASRAYRMDVDPSFEQSQRWGPPGESQDAQPYFMPSANGVIAPVGARAGASGAR